MQLTLNVRIDNKTQLVVVTTTQRASWAMQQTAHDTARYYRQLMVRSRSSASPGAPPRAHRGTLRDATSLVIRQRSFRFGPRSIVALSRKWYQRLVPSRSRSGARIAVMVSQRISPIGTSVPDLLERGGLATRTRRYRSGKEYSRSLRYDAFPYLAPTMRFAIGRFFQLLKG